jgi:hypothetical protein
MDLANQISNKFGNKQNRELCEEDLPELHHDFMCCYGWIPLEEFSKIPIPFLLRMNKYVQQEKKLKYQQLAFTKATAKALGVKFKE